MLFTPVFLLRDGNKTQLPGPCTGSAPESSPVNSLLYSTAQHRAPLTQHPPLWLGCFFRFRHPHNFSAWACPYLCVKAPRPHPYAPPLTFADKAKGTPASCPMPLTMSAQTTEPSRYHNNYLSNRSILQKVSYFFM